MKIIDPETIEEVFPMAAAIDVMEQAMIAVSAGKAQFPLRQVLSVHDKNLFGVMPGVLDAPACFGVKLISIFPGNTGVGLGSHLGVVVLFEVDHGQPVAVLDAGAVTGVRTAAASAAATRALAPPEASTLVIFGTGEQAGRHLEAMMLVRPITQVRIVGRTRQSAEKFINWAVGVYPDMSFHIAEDANAAVSDADIICTVTNSATPLFKGAAVRNGAHINAVGASVASKQEIDEETVLRSSLFVDSRESAFAEAGEIINAMKMGIIPREGFVAEIGDVFAGTKSGRRDSGEITLYRSLGVAAQDIAAAQYIVDRLQEGAH